jgi:hypothetical protein
LSYDILYKSNSGIGNRKANMVGTKQIFPVANKLPVFGGLNKLSAYAIIFSMTTLNGAAR